MSLYPDTPRPISPYSFRSHWPGVEGGPAWAPQSRPLTSFGLHEADVTYRGKSWTNIMILYNFYESIGGASGRFTFVDFNGIDVPGGMSDPGVPWTALFVAKSDGLLVSWDLPTFRLKASPAPAIYENGTVKTSEIVGGSPDNAKLYHISAGAGTDGVDLLTYRIPSTVATAPSPATTGTSLVVAAGTGVNFPATPFYANVWPTGALPIGIDDPLGRTPNVETVQVTTIATDTFTIVRHQNGTSARTIIVSDQIAVAPATTVIVTIDATCRRACRRAKFLAQKNPFVLNVPANYYQETVTILEVRR